MGTCVHVSIGMCKMTFGPNPLIKHTNRLLSEFSKVKIQQFQRLLSSDALSKRQKELMSRGLPKKKTIDGVKHVILVASGKGGVGKSTTAVNLALAFQLKSMKVGILDADVYGPSIPIMMNLNEQPFIHEKTNKMTPLENYGVKCMSMGFLVKPENALVWRGPMVMAAVNKLVHDTHWDPLDVLVIDLPPGTGDIHLSIAQTIEITGSVIVSTPQQVALADAKKAVKMFEAIKIPVLGIVENMSSFVCPSCKEVTHIFGKNHQLLENVEKLGSVPLEVEIMRNSDKGTPFLLTHPESKVTEVYLNIAKKLISKSLSHGS